MKIACPKCDFHPTPNILWQCRPGCGHLWHTFATHGVCPGCSKFWHDTQCPLCKMWSPHDDWYREEAPERQPAIRRKLAEKQLPSYPTKSSAGSGGGKGDYFLAARRELSSMSSRISKAC